jgi:hypothetical protein
MTETFGTGTNDWDHRQNGEIDSDPLSAFLGAAEHHQVSLRLEVRMADGHTGAVQISMTQHEAAELGQCLLFLSERASMASTAPNK